MKKGIISFFSYIKRTFTPYKGEEEIFVIQGDSGQMKKLDQITDPYFKSEKFSSHKLSGKVILKNESGI